MAKLRMAHASTHGARKPPGPKYCKPNHCTRSTTNLVHAAQANMFVCFVFIPEAPAPVS